jgi:hypothetical protein
MCNACGFFCCASDVFAKCGCEGCPNSACWPDDEEDYDDDDYGSEFICESVSRENQGGRYGRMTPAPPAARART